jgi:RHS repeat-associated protein
LPSECPYPILPSFNCTFTDQEDDDELGFYNYGARLYDPVLGKFLSPDSIVQAPDDPQTLNRYSYARNNPLYYNDPTGHEEGGPDQGEGSSTGISPGTSPEPGPLGPGISTGWSSSNSFANETSFWGEVTPSVTTTPLSTENKLGKNPFVIAQAKSPTKKGGYEKGDICFERMRQQIESRGKPGPYDCAICCAELIGAPSYAEIVVCETVCATAFQVYGKDGETR